MGGRPRTPQRADFGSVLRGAAKTGADRLVEFRFKKVLQNTGKAWLFEKLEGGTVWLPRSAFRKGSDDTTVWVIPKWADQKGLR